MGEERNGWTNGARHGLRFYARCAQDARRRSWDSANAWPPVLALLLLSGGAWLAGVDLTHPGDTAYGAPIGTALFIVIAWLAVFLVQFVTAPPRLYARLDAELLALAQRSAAPPVAPVAALSAPASTLASILVATPALPPPIPQPAARPAMRPVPPPIDVRLHDQVYETAAADTTGDRLPASRAYMARVTNRGDKPVRRCQLFFGSPVHIQVVSGPFDLAPGGHRDLPVLRIIDEADEPHALLYFLDAETWHVAESQAAWLPEPGRFKVKVLSANAPVAALDVNLSCSAGTPLAWTLVEAGEPDKAAKAGRKRLTWAASDAVAEPGSGD
ncbi:hypothetical protein BH10PSE6_BH10PSE6_28620 [soil metagenome]